MRDKNSKIQIPNVDRGYIRRSADALLLSLKEGIILLNAGVGYGKTQLLSNYIHSSSAKSAWYSISDADNDLMAFIQNFTKSVQHALGTPEEDFHISGSLPENIDILMEQLVIWLDDRIDFLNVVFDDFQEITNPDIFNLLDILIETMDKKIRLFLVEKNSLPHFFDKYTQNGRAACIGTEELKFTENEIAMLLGNRGEQTGQYAKLIFNCTEGWPIGIVQIMLQFQQQNKSANLETLKGICENLKVSDFFLTRVYKTLPFDIQTFLKKTAVLDYMTPAICNTVTGIHNSEAMLRYLVREKLFVQTLGEANRLYRYHSIFHRFLLSQTTLEEQQEIFRTAAYFLLKTNDKIQAAEYACRGKATDIVQAVIEVSGDSMLEDRLYDTMERWFSFLATEHCELTSKARFIYGKYLMAQGRTTEADYQIKQAEKCFQAEGRIQDYKKALLFCAAAKRKIGEIENARTILAKALEYRETSWSELTESICTEQIKINCCMHQLKKASLLLSDPDCQDSRFQKNPFLAAARDVFTLLTQQEEPDFLSFHIPLEHVPEGFLLRNCILAEQMKKVYLSADYQAARQLAWEIIHNSFHETLQTAIAWEMLAVLSWNEENYRKAVEQSRLGNSFFAKNHIQELFFIPKHRQILNEIHSIQMNSANIHYFILPPQSKSEIFQGPNAVGKVRIQCLNGFLVFLPDTKDVPVKWRTKKTQELFAYLFHLQGEGVSREALIELLWPNAGIKSAIALFHTTLYNIRQTFVQNGLEDLISYEKKKYSLNMELVNSDLEELMAYLKNQQACTERPEQIMQLYPGSYLDSCGYLWSYSVAKDLENQYLKVLKFGAASNAIQSRPESALPFIQRMMETDPYNEEVASQLIACLYHSGRQSEAKHQYDRLQKLYREDLELNFPRSFREIVCKEQS